MKLLHTSDWHIGKRLHGKDLLPDIQLFFSWLLETIQKEAVDVLLVAGDIFDMANPSSESRTVYYQFLVKVSALNCKVIITGGNHDSPAVLNAPKDLLSAINIKVIGGIPQLKEDVLIPLSENVVVAAIPYLRDGDLRNLVRGESYKERKEAIRAGIQKTYLDLAQACKKQYPKATAIAMGHLFVQGAHISPSERGIQMGNEAGVQATEFGTYFSYIALGHIHVPQTISKTKKIYYSGSPIALSFSEKEDEKRVLIFNIKNGVVDEKSLPIPPFRKLLKFEGTLETVKKEVLKANTASEYQNTLIDLSVKEAHYNPMITSELQSFIAEFNDANEAEIIHQRTHFDHYPKGTASLYDPTLKLEDLKPEDVFLKRLEHESMPKATKDLLIEAFQEVYESVLRSEKKQGA